MYKPVSDIVYGVAREVLAFYTNTQQYTYTNFPQNSDTGWDLVNGPPGQRPSTEESRRRDEKNKFDTIRLGPGPNESDSLYSEEPPTMVSVGVPESPKTDAQGEVTDNVKADGGAHNRDTIRSVGPWESQEYV